jgi:hypothetical protein
MVKIRDELRHGSREALVSLADQLASEIDTCPNPRDRLATVRAFLATLARIDAMDDLKRRTEPANDPAVPTVDPVDELLQRRQRRGRA